MTKDGQNVVGYSSKHGLYKDAWLVHVPTLPIQLHWSSYMVRDLRRIGHWPEGHVVLTTRRTNLMACNADVLRTHMVTPSRWV